MKNNISVSILDAQDKIKFLDDLKKVQAEILNLKIKTAVFDMQIHFDVMDKKFVPNEGVELKYIIDVKKRGFYADVHLMVSKPIEDGYIDEAIIFGADNITIHYEIEDFDKTLKYLLKKKKELKLKENRELSIGVSLKPNTQIDVLKKYISKIDKVLLMSVEPGKGGQKYIENTNDKIIFFKNNYPKVYMATTKSKNTVKTNVRMKTSISLFGAFLHKRIQLEMPDIL